MPDLRVHRGVALLEPPRGVADPLALEIDRHECARVRRVEPTEVSGTGVIHLLMLLHQGPLAPDVDYSQPHPVATVELAEQEGLRYTSTVINCPLEEIRIGMPVRLTWIERWGAPYPVFEPAPASTKEVASP